MLRLGLDVQSLLLPVRPLPVELGLVLCCSGPIQQKFKKGPTLRNASSSNSSSALELQLLLFQSSLSSVSEPLALLCLAAYSPERSGLASSLRSASRSGASAGISCAANRSSGCLSFRDRLPKLTPPVSCKQRFAGPFASLDVFQRCTYSLHIPLGIESAARRRLLHLTQSPRGKQVSKAVVRNLESLKDILCG